MAKLYFRYGAMNSGKSTALMQVAHNYEEQGMRVLILKPKVDTKGSGDLVSRLGVRRPADLLVLDEATAGLDPIVRDEVLEIFNEFTREEDHSILISSHILSDLEKLCDTIAFLHKGRLLLCEEKDALREEYALWHGTAAQLAALDTPVYGKRVTPYGIEALVRRDAMPAGSELDPVSIEELFVLMVKGECAA